MSAREGRQKQGARIRAERKKQGFTLKMMSEMLGCSEQAISQYERGTRPIRSEMLEKLANVLQVPVQSFFDDVQIVVESEMEEELRKESGEEFKTLSGFLLAGDSVHDAYKLLKIFTQLNSIGKERLLVYAGDMRSIYKYCKTKEET